jgi:hypothetical protein
MKNVAGRSRTLHRSRKVAGMTTMVASVHDAGHTFAAWTIDVEAGHAIPTLARAIA